jgi:broad specificity phosphatase PhoE
MLRPCCARRLLCSVFPGIGRDGVEPSKVMNVSVKRPQDGGVRQPATRRALANPSGTVKRILLIRNGLCDVMRDPAKIMDIPDWKYPVSAEGYQDNVVLGRQLANMLQREPVYFYFSPYERSKQSLKALLEGALEVRRLNIVGCREDARLRDEDLGRYASKEELYATLKEQQTYGPFFYRFPHGESGADVGDRVSSFLDVFQREKVALPPNTNVLIMTHDLTIRMFIKRWFHLTVDTFHKMYSVPTSTPVELFRTPHDHFKFKLTPESTQLLGLPLSLKDEEGYTHRNTQLLGSLSTGAPFL